MLLKGIVTLRTILPGRRTLTDVHRRDGPGGVRGLRNTEDTSPQLLHLHHITQVEELPETASRTIAAEWNTQTAGGSHIHPDWKKNPCFHLKLRTAGPAKVKTR